MTRVFYSFVLLLPFLVFSQSQDQNYIKTTTYKKATTQGSVTVSNPSDAMVQISYFDGLGRPIQQIAHKQSDTGKDIVTHIEYDPFGRQTKEFLPYVTTAPSLSYIDAQTAIGDLTAFYTDYNGGTSYPFSEKLLETSPLSRVFKQAAPGDAWHMGSGKEIKFDYQTNCTADGVKLFQAISNSSSTSVVDMDYYEENQLYKTITKDENWTSGNNNTTEEFKDKEGRVVLKRTYANIMRNGSTLEFAAKHDTYYIYDQYGNLTAVLPPLAEGSASQVILDELGYQYKYDNRNRLVEKKLPGKQWEFIVYDKLDRPIATGPAFSPYGGTEIGWLITQYDVFGRVTQTGWKQMAVSETQRNSQQNAINSGENPFVLSASDVLTKNYYDTYTYPDAPPLAATVEGQAVATNVKGLPTGSWERVLDSSTPLAATTSYTFYDTKYRPIRSYTKNHLGGYTQVDIHLDWFGKTNYTLTRHKRMASNTEIVVKDMFSYSAQDRMILHRQKINNLQEQLIAQNTYDELGQLTSKKVGGQYTGNSNGLQKVDYSYTIRGWLKAINDVTDITTENDLFAFKINYNDPTNATALFNGNISEIYWKTSSDNTTRKYEYQYDHLNRLLEANYRKPTSNLPNQDNYLEKISYDKNGNIKFLERNGDRDSDNCIVGVQQIDDLEYGYHPQRLNQLMKVTDHSTSPQGFKGRINISDDYDYDYDANGNMTEDKNKGISLIKYNHLNLPTEIVFGTQGKIEYLYTATGQKMTKRVTDTGVVVTTEYLSGGFQYRNAELQFFPQAEGYVKATLLRNGYSFNYVFNYTDHLGNIRLSYSLNTNNELKVLEENHYYPFGLKHTNYNSDLQVFGREEDDTKVVIKRPLLVLPLNPSNLILTLSANYNYKYNGKELQTELGLELYDYGARNYDPAIGRWMNIDQLAETSRRWSPYTYAYNNPMYFVDPDGRENIPALIWAAKNMANKGIPFRKWYGYDGGWTHKSGVVPTGTVCYESCWTSYMNGADASVMNTLKSGFSTKGGGFKGRSHDT